jgi:hypothetical protein
MFPVRNSIPPEAQGKKYVPDRLLPARNPGLEALEELSGSQLLMSAHGGECIN